MAAPTVVPYEKEAGRNTKTLILEITTNAAADSEFPITHDLGFVPTFVELEELAPEGGAGLMGQDYGASVRVVAPNKGDYLATTTVVWIYLDPTGLVAPTTGWFKLRVGRTHSTSR